MTKKLVMQRWIVANPIYFG